VAKAAADTSKIPLFQYIGGIRAKVLPIPMLNIINGGAHAGNELAVQEFMIVPIEFDSFSEALRASIEVYKELKNILKGKYGAHSINVGDEGGFAPPMKFVKEAIEALLVAIKNCGYDYEKQIRISLDAAASQFYIEDKNIYKIDDREMKREELLEYWKNLALEFPLLSIEDPFQEGDFEAYAELRKEVKDKIIIVGDDLTVTNVGILRLHRTSQIKWNCNYNKS
jgi:enolase